ncbi:dihydrofolate reductase [Aliirhizobium terrae]|uniref:dihydrofolate reductase n=1 Tax=Terrirhizobium terrae TaxID=2926709 RepID=UPI0025791D3E|nr:dihydrofolate reductase [Rhizobium sp. CC-CFT758]WJH40263.1 dihydrofolate reductase [Rhizobium sp. CC-CFT758]
MPSVASIVARSYPDKIIGIENQLPWHLGTDLQLFKKRTQGNAVIMGRKTFESIGRPLPNRKNIILSRTEPDYLNDHKDLVWAPDPSTAFLIADMASIISGKMEFFVIGGEQIYKTFHTYLNRIFVTDVFCGHINGDAKYEVDFDAKTRGTKSEWIIEDEEEFPKSDKDEFPFRITEYRRRVPYHRYRVKEELMGRSPDIDVYWQQYELKLHRLEEEAGEQLDFFA